MRTLNTGDTFLHYRIGRLLGEGFHGQVRELIHPHTGDRFALKTMQLARVGDARAARRAMAEARGTYGIDHANVIKVFDLNCEEDGLVWMRTELLEGETLADLLSRLGFLSPLFAISAAIETAYGLHAAHEAQIIHRDVKPANLFHVRPTQAIKVIDFSIAKFFAERFETTAGRAGMGTPAYMGPEQLEGMLPTPSFDIYALGITLWQLLAGRHPWHDAIHLSRELFRRHFTDMPPLLADVVGLPPEVDALVRRAVAKDPVNRFHSMREMAQALVDLRATLERDAAAGRILLRAAPGEPPIPGDPRVRRDYTPPAAIPRGEQPTPPPSARVLVPASGPGGTVPLASEPLPSRAALVPNTPTEVKIQRRTELLPAVPTPARSPETPTTVTRSAPSPAPHRVPWIAVSAAVVLVSATTAGIAWWLGARAPGSVAPAVGAPASSAPSSVPIASAPSAIAPIAAASASPAASASASPTAAVSAPRPRATPPRSPRRAAPAITTPPTPPARPPAPPRARSRTFDVDN